MLLPGPSFRLVNCFARFTLSLIIFLFASRGGKSSLASSAFFRIFALLSFCADRGLNVTGATSCPSTVRRRSFCGCNLRGGIGWYLTSLLKRVWQNILSRASTAALRFVRDVSWAMFCPSFSRLTVVGIVSAASFISSTLSNPSLYSNSGGANGSGSVSGGSAGGGGAAIGSGTRGNGATIGAAAGIGTGAGAIGATAGPRRGTDSRIRAGASGRLLCPPFAGWMSSKSWGKESSKSPG